jgi:hypothetical protein
MEALSCPAPLVSYNFHQLTSVFYLDGPGLRISGYLAVTGRGGKMDTEAKLDMDLGEHSPPATMHILDLKIHRYVVSL